MYKDREAVQQLEAKIRSERTSCEEEVDYNALTLLNCLPTKGLLSTSGTGDKELGLSFSPLKALYYAALFLWLTGKYDKSREYADRLLKVAPESESGLSLRGWIDLTSGRDAFSKKSIKYFEEAIAIHTQQRYIILINNSIYTYH